MADVKLTYGDVRSNAEKIVDAHVKARVIRGIERLKKEWGEDWVDHIDSSTLVLSSASHCVLGQLYRHSTPTDEQILHAKSVDPYGFGGDWSAYGYTKGLAIIDADVLEAPQNYGFMTDDDYDESFGELQEAWLVAFGREDLLQREEDE